MALAQVTSILTGAAVTGGGVTQMYFQNFEDDAQECVNAVESFWEALMPETSNGLTVTTDAAVPYFLESTGELIGIAATTPIGPLTGAQTNQPLPRATQGLIKWQTTGIVNNRVVRGRTFLPGMVEDNNFAPGVPGGNIVLAAEAAIAALIEDGVANFGIWHRPRAGTGGLYNEVTSGTFWDQWAVLRSRRD